MAENDVLLSGNGDEEFNSLLNAAAKMVNKNSDNGEQLTFSGDSGKDESAENISSPPPVSFSGGSGKLTQEAIEALLNSAPPKESIDDAFIDKVMNEENPLEKPMETGAENTGVTRTALDDDTEKMASILGGGLSSDEEDNEVTVTANSSPDGIPDEIVGKKRGFGFIITIAVAVVAAALGFCVCLLLFGDIFKSGNEEFAIKAANAVNSSLPVNNELYIYKAYVKNGSAATECILYGVVDYNGEIKTDIFRVVVRNEEPNKLSVYYTVDENDEDYIAMKNSEDLEVKIQASILKNYSDGIYAADKEIRIGVPEWEDTDCGKINKNITSQQVKNAN